MAGTDDFNKQAKAFDDYCDNFMNEKVKLNFNDPVEKYMNLTEDQMRKMSLEDMAIASIVLTRYALYVQLAYNTELSRLNRFKGKLMEIICKETHNYKGASFEERKYQATLGNDVARKCNGEITAAQGKVDRLSFVATHITGMAAKMDNLRQAKR